MKTWRFGIIGCGGIAAFHREAIRGLPHAQLVCVSSRAEDRAQAFAQEWGGDCAWTTDYRQLLARPDVELVCITTHSGSHYRIGADALRAGKHVVIEKPMAMTVEEAQHLIDLSQEHGRVLTVISQRRFEPQIQRIQQLLADGKLGKLLLIEVGTPYYRTQAYYDSSDWRGTIAEDGGALMNQGIHQIDLMLWLGGEAHSVYGKTATQTHRMEAEDLGAAIVKFRNGAIGTVMASTSLRPGLPPFIHVYGDKGAIKVEGQSIVFWDVEGIEAPVIEEVAKSDGSSNPLAISGIYHQMQLEELLLSLEQQRAPLVTGRDGQRAVQLILSIGESSVSGKEIVLEQ